MCSKQISPHPPTRRVGCSTSLRAGSSAGGAGGTSRASTPPAGRSVLPGVGFFVTTFKLDIEQYLDVHMSFTFEDPLGAAYRALLFMNWWMMASAWPQAKFPGDIGLSRGEQLRWLCGRWRKSPFPQVFVSLWTACSIVRTGNPRWSAQGREV
ncbi:hypothetical protein FB451DRAFT_1189305 [Mycena latifolia]|nr:hypothetical protein FB451DRAFT_1189305 [Mycena latifolia]